MDSQELNFKMQKKIKSFAVVYNILIVWRKDNYVPRWLIKFWEKYWLKNWSKNPYMRCLQKMAHPVYMRESIYKHSSVDDRESYTEGFRWMNGISPFPAPFDSPLLLSLFHDGSPAALVTTDHLPIPIRLSFIYMLELSAPDGRIPTTFSRFSLDSDTLLTFSTHSSSLSLSIFLFPFRIKATIDPECSRLFKIENRIGSTPVRAIRLGESRQVCDPSAGNWQWNSLRARVQYLLHTASISRPVCYRLQLPRSLIIRLRNKIVKYY